MKQQWDKIALRLPNISQIELDLYTWRVPGDETSLSDRYTILTSKEYMHAFEQGKHDHEYEWAPSRLDMLHLSKALKKQGNTCCEISLCLKIDWLNKRDHLLEMMDFVVTVEESMKCTYRGRLHCIYSQCQHEI